MRKGLLLGFMTVALSGCATYYPSVPENYEGPTATIVDSAHRIDPGKADLFYLSHVDGKKIENSRVATFQESYGQGNLLRIALKRNKVPAQKQAFTIVGRTTYALPARALVGTVYELKGDIEFTPEQDRRYIVKGELSEKRSSVWIEDALTEEVLGKIEFEGDSKLGFFAK